MAVAPISCEDDGILAMNTMRQLVNMEHEVTGIAKSFDTALSKLQEKRPELVLMDIRLHGPLTGIDITRSINEKFDIPVIYVTAHADEETLAEINKTKHFGIISKPFESSQLKEAIDNWL
jgi:DNA-binding NtrC family response regulator